MAQDKNGEQKSGAQSGQSMTIDQALETAHRHWNAGQMNQAEVLCQKVLEAWPGNALALHLLGLMAHNWNNLDLAIDYLRKACLSPQAPAVFHSNLSEMCRQKGLLAEGEDAARRATAMDPKLVGAWNNLGIILQEAGKYDESLSCLERVIAMQPEYPQGLNNLGNTHKRMGQLDKAGQCYRRAIELAPNYPEAHSNLSNLLKDTGDIDGAIEVARKAIEENPRFADAYVNAAAAEATRGKYDRSVTWINSLLAFAPTHATALAAKAEYQNKMEIHAEALATAKQALAVSPENGDAHNSLGKALQSLGKYDEALAAFDKAASCRQVSVPEQAFINKGTLLMEINRSQEAAEAFDRAIAVNPKSVAAYFNKSDIKKFDKGDPDIEAMESLLAKQCHQNISDKMVLHFALGKAWMDANDPAKAFLHLHEGNRIKRAAISYDPAQVEGLLSSVADVFSQDFIQRSTADGAKSDLPVFIIGMPRSGTTLIEQILAAHPDVHGAGELSAMRRAAEGLRSADGQAIAYPTGFGSLPEGAIKAMGQTYLDCAQRLAGGRKRMIDKMPANFIYAGIIAAALPDARIIHCRRDPVDTCLSCYTKLFTERQDFVYDLSELGRFYKAYTKLMEHWRKVLPQDRFIEVDYEAVVENLEPEARKMIAFCGLDWDDKCLSFHKSDRPVRSASLNQVRKPVYKQSVGRWKAYKEFLEPLLKELDVA